MTAEDLTTSQRVMGHSSRESNLNAASELMGAIRSALLTVFHGVPLAVDYAILGLVTEGHVLIEDLPGLGKTTLAKGLARVAGLHWQRIQGTSDLLPSDVTGSMVPMINDESLAKSTTGSPSFGNLAFKKGPVFSNVVLFDELNRASPRAQSALLEAMEERSVTVDGHSYSVPRPFFVIATQNPSDVEGTFLLPQNQLDRFLLRINLGYPSRVNESKILEEGMSSKSFGHGNVDSLVPVTNIEGIENVIESVAKVFIAEPLREYLLDLLWATRSHPDLDVGASPRSGLALQRSAKALALLRGRDFVTPDDLKAVFIPVVSHRVRVVSSGRYSGVTPNSVLSSILMQVSAPVRASSIS